MNIWAHRGASGEAPENTLEAFALAARQGADGVELDVQLSKEGEVVVIHDEMIDRTSNGSGRVRDYTLRELKQFNFNNAHPKCRYASIPSLREVFELLRPTKLTMNVELKAGFPKYTGLEEKCLALASECGFEERVLYSSFDHSYLVRLKQLNPKARTGILFDDRFFNIPQYAKRLGMDAVHPSAFFAKLPGFIRKCQKLGLDVNVWNVRNADVKFFRKRGITSIITDFPGLSKAII